MICLGEYGDCDDETDVADNGVSGHVRTEDGVDDVDEFDGEDDFVDLGVTILDDGEAVEDDGVRTIFIVIRFCLELGCCILC